MGTDLVLGALTLTCYCIAPLPPPLPLLGDMAAEGSLWARCAAGRRIGGRPQARARGFSEPIATTRDI